MGNLRSVSQAVQAAAEGSGWQVLVTSRPEDARRPAHRAARAGRHARLHARAARIGAARSVLEAAATKPLFGVCGHADAAGPQRRGRHAGLGLIHGECSSSTWRADPAGRQPLTRCRRWAGTRCASCPWRCRTGVAGADGSHFYFVHSFMPGRSMRATAQARPITASRAAIARDNLLRRNSTRKKARTWPAAVPQFPALESVIANAALCL